MRFVDEAKIKVTAGAGGPGCVSFWREAFVPMGGPDGGDGGAGGDIIFKATTNESTLQDFRYKRAYKADSGRHGSGANKTGRSGEDTVVLVPCGTVIRDANSGDVLIDLTEKDQTWTACEGGRGGKGNAHFVTSTFQAPKFAQDGELGEEKELILELKLLADVAIIGYPNAGKSTLISRLSAAKPKIADYAFTTLTPNLGVVEIGDYRRIVVADVPGLIEGAHTGKGLGHRFLKHIERCRVLIHMLDGGMVLDQMTKPDFDLEQSQEILADTLWTMYQAIRNELKLFDPAMLDKPELIVINKADLIPDPVWIHVVNQLAKKTGSEPLLISSMTHRGLDTLIATLKRMV